MPVSLSQMMADTATVSLTTNIGTINVVYYPNRVSDTAMAQLDQGSDEFNDTLASLMQSWDIFEDDAQTTMLPIDAAHLGALGLSFRIKLAWSIIRDIRPETAASQATS